MVVHHAGGLHKGVDDDGADKFEAALFELLRHFDGERRLRGDRAFGPDGLAAHDAPEKRGEVFARFLHLEVDAGGLNGGFNFGARANDAGILEQTLDIGFAEAGDFRRIESLEGFAEGVALAQHDDPCQAGLKSFEHEQLPERAAVALGHAPLRVVVVAEEWIALGPGAAGFRSLLLMVSMVRGDCVRRQDSGFELRHQLFPLGGEYG